MFCATLPRRAPEQRLLAEVPAVAPLEPAHVWLVCHAALQPAAQAWQWIWAGAAVRPQGLAQGPVSFLPARLFDRAMVRPKPATPGGMVSATIWPVVFCVRKNTLRRQRPPARPQMRKKS